MIRILRYIKGTLGQGCYMKTKVTLRLLDIVMQIGQSRPQIVAPLQDSVFIGGNLIS